MHLYTQHECKSILSNQTLNFKTFHVSYKFIVSSNYQHAALSENKEANKKQNKTKQLRQKQRKQHNIQKGRLLTMFIYFAEISMQV